MLASWLVLYLRSCKEEAHLSTKDAPLALDRINSEAIVGRVSSTHEDGNESWSCSLGKNFTPFPNVDFCAARNARGYQTLQSLKNSDITRSHHHHPYPREVYPTSTALSIPASPSFVCVPISLLGTVKLAPLPLLVDDPVVVRGNPFSLATISLSCNL